MPEHQEHQEHQGQGHQGQSDHAGHQNHHEMMVADFRRRFWISIVVTVPVLLLSPLIQDLLGLEALAFPGDSYILLALSTFIFGYGGYPFLSGAADELKKAHPGMMTLVAVAITTAFAYSAAVVLGLSGEVFFWELATLVDIMLLGHWVEMRSVMGASKALEELASLMPDEAQLVQEAQESRSRSQDLADRAAMWLTIVAITAGAITLAAWLLAGRAFEFALGRTITVMVITCPHALGL